MAQMNPTLLDVPTNTTVDTAVSLYSTVQSTKNSCDALLLVCFSEEELCVGGGGGGVAGAVW